MLVQVQDGVASHLHALGASLVQVLVCALVVFEPRARDGALSACRRPHQQDDLLGPVGGGVVDALVLLQQLKNRTHYIAHLVTA